MSGKGEGARIGTEAQGQAAPLWRWEELAKAAGGRIEGQPQGAGITGLGIDSRSIGRGDLFVALKDRRDGHDFVADAALAGAAGALVTHRPEGVEPGFPLVVVENVEAALSRLAKAARARMRGRVIAVTGSAGKTSTKEMLRAMLAQEGKVHAAERSFNNHWGVPLTLARMPREADFAVVEIGMNAPGEITPLAALARPHVALVTTIAPAHMAAFASLDEIARAKAEIFSGLEAGGVAVINRDAPASDELGSAAQAAGARIIGFGKAANGRAGGDGQSADVDWVLEDLRLTSSGLVAEAMREGPGAGGTGPAEDPDRICERFVFKLASPARHFALNALGALAAAEAAGADLARSLIGLAGWQTPAGRGRIRVVPLDPVRTEEALSLIDDAYNANPASMVAALEVLATLEPGPGGRRIAILGDMLELGAEEAAFHADLAALPSMAAIDVVHMVGPRMAALAAALPEAQRGIHAEEVEAFLPRLHQLFRPGDVVLVKGSNGVGLARVVDAIDKLGHPARGSAAGRESPAPASAPGPGIHPRQ